MNVDCVQVSRPVSAVETTLIILIDVGNAAGIIRFQNYMFLGLIFVLIFRLKIVMLSLLSLVIDISFIVVTN